MIDHDQNENEIPELIEHMEYKKLFNELVKQISELKRTEVMYGELNKQADELNIRSQQLRNELDKLLKECHKLTGDITPTDIIEGKGV